MRSANSTDARRALQILFGTDKYAIGMVHLLPLPGSPTWAGEMSMVLQRALADAQALEEGGVDGIIVENFGDVPFGKGRVEAHTVAAMTMVVSAVRQAVDVPVGVNVLRNDSKSALAIASVTDCQFVRANVHVGAMVTDQGIVEGQAYETMRYRQVLGSVAKVFADVLVKHAFPLGQQSLEHVARDTAYRGLADAIIVTGSGTGQPTEMEDLVRVKETVPDIPVLVGSGVEQENVARFLSVADGVIVGTSLKEGRLTTNPVDKARVERLVAAVRAIR